MIMLFWYMRCRVEVRQDASMAWEQFVPKPAVEG